MERALPTITIEGTEFLIDVMKLELRERNNADNSISLFEMKDLGNFKGYHFTYSSSEKNIPSLFNSSKNLSVIIPEFIQLDPEGMSERYGIPMEMFATKCDFDIMVDQEALQTRLSGLLPIIDIAGHTFYVDLRMDMLRPKDDFLSKGIEFSKIDDYYVEDREQYVIPYNPKTHEFCDIDFSTVTEIPKDLIVISFPHESVLDPVGNNRKHGFDDTFNLKETNLKSHFKSGQVSWKDTGIEDAIVENKPTQLKNSDVDIKPSKIDKGRKL